MTPTQPSQAVEAAEREIDLILSDPETNLSHGSRRALLWLRMHVASAELARPQEVAAPVTESMIAAGQRELEAIRRSDLCGDHELIKRVLEAASRVSVALPAEPCRDSRARMEEYACRDRAQCRESCGELGRSAEQGNAKDALQQAVADAWENYERMGATCHFEGAPMIHASTLEEIHDAAILASKATSTPADPYGY